MRHFDESEAKSLWVEVFRHQKAESELSTDDMDVMEINAWMDASRRLRDAVCELANQTGMQLDDLWKDAVYADSRFWKQAILAISRTADDPVEAADDDAIPPEYQTKPMSKTAAVRIVGGSTDTLTRDMDAGRIRFIKVSRQRFIFDSRQVK